MLELLSADNSDRLASDITARSEANLILVVLIKLEKFTVPSIQRECDKWFLEGISKPYFKAKSSLKSWRLANAGRGFEMRSK